MKKNTLFHLIPSLAASLITVLFTSSASANPEPILIFDGIEGVVESEWTATDLGVGGSNPKTIEAWVKTREFNWQGIIQLGDRGTDGGDFSLRAAGTTDEWHGLFWGPDSDLFFTVPDSLNTWTHLAITYDGSTVRAYGNGEERASLPLALDTQDGPLEVGKWFFDDSFDGSIRDVRIWNVARSEAEIQATMNSSPAGQPGLALWWPLDEGAGQVANDQSGNNRNGAIFAAQWEGQQFEYDPNVEADFVFDFGTGAGKVGDLSLLRNRPDHFSLQEDALRMTARTDNFISSSAVASVINRAAMQNFTVESDINLNNFPDPRASRVGLVVLGGPHVPVEAPFNTAEERDFFTLSFFPGAETSVVNTLFPNVEPAGDDTAIIAIARGFNGPFLAAARWDGRKPLPNPVLMEDDFENAATDGDWQMGGTNNSWEIGAPSFGPSPTAGARVAATNLDSPIAPSTEDWLRSPVIDLGGIDSAVLTFWEALQIDDATPFGSDEPFHKAFVRVVNEGGTTVLAEIAEYSGDSGGWRERSFFLPATVLGQRIRVEFHVSTDEYVLAEEYGWMIDRFSVGSVQEDLSGYAMRGEGAYGLSGELELTFTLTDLADGGAHSQSVSATILNPLSGNLFGIGGRLQSSPLGHPEIDFRNVSMTLGEVQSLVVPTTVGSTFQYSFGAGEGLVAPDRFALLFESDWTLQDGSLRAETTRESGNSVAVTRIREFKDGNPLQVEADVVMTSHDAGAEGRVGLILFGQQDPALFNPDDGATYYSFQYISGGAGGDKIAFRRGMDGEILYQAPFSSAPIAGATYRFAFSGAFDGNGAFLFTASLDDGNGGQASLSGEVSESLELRNRFGFGAAQGGGDVWDFLRFAGNTTDGQERMLVFDGGDTVVETGVDVVELGIEGSKRKTIEAWVYARSFNGGGALQLGTTGSNSQDFSLRAGGVQDQWQAQFWGAADMFFDVPGSHNKWTHLAIAYTGTAVNIFANGELVAVQGVALNTRPGGGLRIGNWLGHAFNGAIRDVRVWNVARSGPQIQATMNSSPAGEAGLLGWWLLNEGVDNIAHDSSGNDRNGAITDPQWASVTGNLTVGGPEDVINFLDFDGAETVVQTGLTATDLGIEGNKPKTLEAWVNPREFNWQGIIQLGTRGPAGADLSMRLAGQTDQFHGLFWGTDLFFSVPGALNNWTHLAFTYDGSTLRAYGNGQLIQAIAISLNTGDGPFEIGKWANDPPFNGGIRDVRIWNVARSAPQIEATMHSSPAGQPGLVAWLPMDEGAGSVAFDGSGHGRDGAIVAGQWDSVPAVHRFGRALVLRNGTPLTLAWDAMFATSVSIQPGIEEAGTGGMLDIVAPANRVTTYSLVPADKNGVSATTPSIWVRSVPEDGFETVRYVRFELPGDDALRDPDADSIQLSRFFFFRNGARVDAVGISNPGGDNPPGAGPSNLLGDNPETTWRDFNKAHLGGSQLVFDFGSVVEIDSYQLGTASDAPGRDPQQWRLFGRNSTAEEWRMIEEMDLDFPLPSGRQALSAIVPLAGPAGPGLTFGDWVDEHFPDADDRANPEISGPLADPAGDGVANLLKYAFGFDPWMQVGAADLPQADFAAGKLRLTYPERVDATDISYRPEKSFTLADWNEGGIQEVPPRQPTEDGKFEWVTVELEMNAAAAAFLHVLVLKNE